MKNIRKSRLSRSVKSWVCANIIIDQGLFNEFEAWRLMHQSIKSNYRAGSLFLLNKKLRYRIPKRSYSVNMDTLSAWYYGD